MEKGTKPIGKLSDVELANALSERKDEPMSETKADIKDRNILRDEMFRIEKQRYESQQSFVSEWARIHTRFATDIELVRKAMAQTHTYIREQIQQLPVDKAQQQLVSDDIQDRADDINDTVEDKLYELETIEVQLAREENLEARRQRLSDRAEAERKRKAEAERKERERRDAERKAAEEAERKEAEKRKQSALSESIPSNEMIMNACGVNSNLLQFPQELAMIVRQKSMLHASMARTKSGLLVVVISKAGKDKSENVRLSVRDGKTAVGIVNNSFCKYIREKYELDEDGEYRFDIKYVAYADDIKVKINNLIQ